MILLQDIRLVTQRVVHNITTLLCLPCLWRKCHIVQIFTTGPCLPCLWRQCCVRVTPWIKFCHPMVRSLIKPSYQLPNPHQFHDASNAASATVSFNWTLDICCQFYNHVINQSNFTIPAFLLSTFVKLNSFLLKLVQF